MRNLSDDNPDNETEGAAAAPDAARAVSKQEWA